METTNAATTAPAELRKMKILIVDDEPANLTMLECLLTTSGYPNVKAIRDSRIAMQTCNSFEPDIVLLDLMMPHVGGFAVLAALRSEIADRSLPVVVLTADVTERTKLRALHASATDFLTKPFDHTEVLVRIGNLLEMRRLHRLVDNQRAAFEEALRERMLELREANKKIEELTEHLLDCPTFVDAAAARRN